MRYIVLLLAFIPLFALSRTKEKGDLLVYHARIYTVDASFSIAEAMVIKNGKIIAIGKQAVLEAHFDAAEKLDAGGKYIFPGFIDAHAHFVEYGRSLQRVNLVGTTNWTEVTDRTAKFVKQESIKPGSWIIGRGWDQNDWDVKEFPDKKILDQLFPDNPVILSRIDGHAAIVNQQALEISGIRPGEQVAGGEIETKNGQLTGILVDNAVELVESKIPAPGPAQTRMALLAAQHNCFAMGLTTVDDCGLDYATIEFINTLQQSGDLYMRIYAMYRDAPENFIYAFAHGRIKTAFLNVRAFKVYADGALGSRGACLLLPYTDKPGWNGFILSSQQHFDSVAALLYQKGFQLCTHAIGDSGNRIMLKTYAKYLARKNDLRWRIEHAQVVNTNDFASFGKYNIIPSVQPTHATSDMYWAADRLGPQRIKGAYAYQQLLKQNGWMPLGTDFPVEDISPFRTFYAAVVRKDASGWPEKGFQPENALSRQQALRGMTCWAARANFEENEKGSLEKGKFADFVILDKDLMKATEKELLQVIVLKTFVGGKMVYERN